MLSKILRIKLESLKKKKDDNGRNGFLPEHDIELIKLVNEKHCNELLEEIQRDELENSKVVISTEEGERIDNSETNNDINSSNSKDNESDYMDVVIEDKNTTSSSSNNNINNSKKLDITSSKIDTINSNGGSTFIPGLNNLGSTRFIFNNTSNSSSNSSSDSSNNNRKLFSADDLEDE